MKGKNPALTQMDAEVICTCSLGDKIFMEFI